MGVSGLVLGCINVLILCLSIPILSVGFLIKYSSDSPCYPILYKPLIAIGICLLIISLVGMIGSCCRLHVFLWLYVFLLLVTIAGLLASLTVGAAIIRSEGENGGKEMLNGGVREYELKGFSGWLKMHVVGAGQWEDVKTCLIHHDGCGKMNTFRSVMDFVTMKRSKLTSIEVGCCKPMAECGYEYESGTTWRIPTQGLTSKDPECGVWNNDIDKLCYNCETCKAGYLNYFMIGWRKITTLNAVILVILLIIFIIACCALAD